MLTLHVPEVTSPQPHLLLPACQEAGDPLVDGGDTVSWESLEERISGMVSGI